MSWNTRRNQIVAAVDSTVQVFNMRDPGWCYKIYVVLPRKRHCVVFLGILLILSQCLSLHPGV